MGAILQKLLNLLNPNEIEIRGLEKYKEFFGRFPIRSDFAYKDMDIDIDPRYGEFIVLYVNQKTCMIDRWYYDDGPFETVVEDDSTGGTFGGYDSITTRVISKKSEKFILTTPPH